MSLEVISFGEKDKWNKIVQSFEKYDVYYLNEYAEAFMVHGDGIPLLFYYQGAKMRAINVCMKRDIAQDSHYEGKLEKEKYFDLITPYGYGGFLVEGEYEPELEAAYCQYCKEYNIICEFVRFHPLLCNGECLSEMYEVISLGNTVYMDLTDDIWANCTSKNRNMIRKAQKSGVEVFWDRSEELAREFQKIYNGTMDKDNAASYYYFGEEFYDSILNSLREKALFFYCKIENKIVAMSIVLFANKQMHYHLSGSLAEYRSFAPTNLLLYEAARYGKEHGYEAFHLGGGLGSKKDNLYSFKKSFNRKEDCVFQIGKKIFDYKKYQELVDMRDDVVREDFFPVYRS